MPFAVEISGFVGVLALLIGVWGVLAPGRIAELVSRFGSAGGLWFATAVGLVFGLGLWFAARASRAPLLLQSLGVFALIAVLVLPFLGVDRFKSLLDWWTKLSPTAKRLNCLVAVAFGAAVLWALLPAAS